MFLIDVTEDEIRQIEIIIERKFLCYQSGNIGNHAGSFLFLMVSLYDMNEREVRSMALNDNIKKSEKKKIYTTTTCR